MKAYVVLKCPMCLGEPDKIGVEMACSPLASHGPAAHEQRERLDDTVSYGYRCPRCGFGLNYPRRLTV